MNLSSSLKEPRCFPRLVLSGALLLAASASSLLAQYPDISSEIKEESNRRHALMAKNSDEAFARAEPLIKDWDAKGRPYRPWAANPDDLLKGEVPAFPGAQGGGMYTIGGRGGQVFVVTSLEDRGPGTFREALEAGGPRIVVFNVAGIIRLKERIRIRAPYITIVGSSAPGDGVCIAGDTVEIETHDVIIRHMRFRRGETWVGDRNDSLGGNPTGNIMLDHISASWGLDENMSMYRHMYDAKDGKPALKLPTVNITIQNSISAESLDRFHHAFGSTIGGRNSTFHHNLWANNTGRNPSIGMDGDFTFANNVLFNYRHRTIDGGDDKSRYNIFNNFLKPGPNTPKEEVAYRLLKPESSRDKNRRDAYGKAYVNGNVVEGYDAVTADNWNGGVQIALTRHGKKVAVTGSKDLVDEFTESLEDFKAREIATLKGIRTDEKFPHAPFTFTDARTAYDFVLAHAGATLPRRDAVDTRIIEMVRSGQVTRTVDVPDESYQIVGKKKVPSDSYKRGIIVHPAQVGGYPDYKGTPYVDTDKDGMPDTWELKNGLNPNDPADAAKDANGDGYTNIEKFLYGLDPKSPKKDWNDPRNNIDTLL